MIKSDELLFIRKLAQHVVGATIWRPRTCNARPYEHTIPNSAEMLFSLPICVIMRWVMK